MSSISYFLVAMLLCNGFGFIVSAQVVGGGSSSGIPSFVGIDGGSKFSPSGLDQIHHRLITNNGVALGPCDPIYRSCR